MTKTTSVELPCDSNVFENGVHICTIGGPSAAELEAWIRLVRVLSQQNVDWHFIGGRAVVKFLGDGNIVRRVISATREQLYPKAEDNDDFAVSFRWAAAFASSTKVHNV